MKKQVKKRKISPEQLKRIKKDQKISKGKGAIRMFAKILIVLVAFYIMIGFIAPSHIDYQTSITVKNNEVALKDIFSNFEQIRRKKSSVDSIMYVKKGSLPIIKWQEIFGEGGSAVYEGNWKNQNAFQVKTIKTNIDVTGYWEYSWELKGDSIEIKAIESVDIENIGYRFTMLFHDSFQELDNELEIIKGALDQ